MKWQLGFLVFLHLVQNLPQLHLQFFSVPYSFLRVLYVVSLVADGKEFACNAGDLGSIPGFGRSPGEENGNPL